MVKWADYGITGVAYNNAGTHINCVVVRKDNGDGLGNPFIEEREAITNNISKGITYTTVNTKESKFSKGNKVGVITVNGNKYLRTDRNNTEKDNLESLPEI